MNLGTLADQLDSLQQLTTRYNEVEAELSRPLHPEARAEKREKLVELEKKIEELRSTTIWPTTPA